MLAAASSMRRTCAGRSAALQESTSKESAGRSVWKVHRHSLTAMLRAPGQPLAAGAHSAGTSSSRGQAASAVLHARSAPAVFTAPAPGCGSTSSSRGALAPSGALSVLRCCCSRMHARTHAYACTHAPMHARLHALSCDSTSHSAAAPAPARLQRVIPQASAVDPQQEVRCLRTKLGSPP